METTPQTPRDADTRTCPLCGARLLITPERYTLREILDLWSDAGISFMPSTIERLGPADAIVTLHRCPDCGFGMFLPTTPGPPDFYAELSARSDTYYLADKWEYSRAIEHVRRGDRVLDVGCGAGRFLDLAAARGAVTSGLEYNEAAASTARASGHDVRLEPVEAAPDLWSEGFDVVSSFQVLEHVEDPVSFARAHARLLRPGGRLIIAVPNDLGSLRWVVPAASNVPPHHLTRWTSDALTRLAGSLGLTPSSTEYEPLDDLHFDHLVWSWRNGALAAVTRRDPHYRETFLDKVVRRLLGLLVSALRALGVRRLPWVRGHSVLVVLTRP